MHLKIGRIYKLIVSGIVIALLLLALVAFIIQYRLAPGKNNVNYLKPPTIKIVFIEDTKMLSDFGFCSKSNLYIYKNDSFKIYSTNIELICSIKSPGDNKIISSSSAKFALYSKMNPSSYYVHFFDSTGKLIDKINMRSPIWCADVSQKDDVFCFGTSKGRLSIVKYQGNNYRLKTRQLRGTLVSLFIDETSSDIIYSTWQNSRLGKYSIGGNRKWSRDMSSDTYAQLYNINGSQMFVFENLPIARSKKGYAQVINENGTELSCYTLKPYQFEYITVSPNGRYLLLAEKRTIKHKKQFLIEHDAFLYTNRGTLIWKKGSLFLQLYPLLITDKGFTISYDAKNSIVILDRNGSVKKSIPLPQKIISWKAEFSGSRVLVNCADEKLYLIEIH